MTVELGWPAYSLDWSESDEHFCRLAVSSFVPAKANTLKILQAAKKSDPVNLLLKAELGFDFVGTKVSRD